MMFADIMAGALMAILLAADLSSKGLGPKQAAMIAPIALAPLILADLPGLAILCLGTYALGTRLSRMAAGHDDRACLPAALAAGLLTLTGPFGAVGASAAIVIHALADNTRPRAEALLIGAVLLFLPLTLLLGLMVAASIESGNGWGIEAGAGIFLRGPLHKSGPEALFIAVPLLGPLILFVLRPNRTGQSASLAIAGGGIIAALIFATQAPLRAFFIVAALIAAIEQGPRWAAPALIFSAALGAIALFGPISRQAPVPLAGAWQLVRAASATPLAWGAPSLPSGAPLPAIARENGRYILIQPTGHPLIHY